MSLSLKLEHGIELDCGVVLPSVQVAYQTYGTLADKKDNVIIICHAMTGDQYVASHHPVTGKEGWWSRIVGPGCAIDTERFFVICMNVLGSCMGTTGPASLNEQTGKIWGTDFPPISIRDMVRVQYAALQQMGIETVKAVIGGSMGGMQVLQWAALYPSVVESAMVVASSPYQSAQNIAFNEVGRQAIINDPNWHQGAYFHYNTIPEQGLAVARMVAHITYLSEVSLNKKFGRKIRPQSLLNQASRQFRSGTFLGNIFEVESYLHYQGSMFIKRFDANAYITITQAIDRFDLAAEYEGSLVNAFKGTGIRFCIVSISSDWLYPTAQSRQLVQVLNQVAANVSFVEISSDRGHDAFLLDVPEFEMVMRGFMNPRLA
ncbi:homoserine O-acetyltransferase MetX [Entomobacter blattae]|uniref:Homoserine O-acetyltransferase n=1 Tax=Entomobacter blattae TaxID=2762277 RepID=A0A7H1NSQ7_9PROT|nr:homoserine O-acetyltransferase [Entomobacter blattae]QNT78817.1 Homoserine O-acetyltransferase [Entomobacter blattae]